MNDTVIRYALWEGKTGDSEDSFVAYSTLLHKYGLDPLQCVPGPISIGMGLIDLRPDPTGHYYIPIPCPLCGHCLDDRHFAGVGCLVCRCRVGEEPVDRSLLCTSCPSHDSWARPGCEWCYAEEKRTQQSFEGEDGG